MTDTERMARAADCLHVNLTGDRAMALERLQRFASLAIADFIARTPPPPIVITATPEQMQQLREQLSKPEPLLSIGMLPAEPDFVAEAVAAEREACAQVCLNAIATIWEYQDEAIKTAARNVCENLAAAIRERGAA